MLYANLLERFFYEQWPAVSATGDTRFEAISAAVFGSKQRRNGPMPSPEAQVAVRDVIRAGLPTSRLVLFVPWGSRKQETCEPFDLLDFCALKQLQLLHAELSTYGIETQFFFRLEDCTDAVLFPEDTTEAQTRDYCDSFTAVCRQLLPTSTINRESQCVTRSHFVSNALTFADLFQNVLQAKTLRDIENGIDRLHRHGWVGLLPGEQVDYYRRCMRNFYPTYNAEQINYEVSKYFAATLTRHLTGSTLVPNGSVQVCFSPPVPFSPIHKPRVSYRSIPERFTHTHIAPWIGKGFFTVTENDECIPKCVHWNHAANRAMNFHTHDFIFADVSIKCDYTIE